MGRVGASIFQGVASTAAQAGFKGDVDFTRVAMEMTLAGIMGNPRLAEMRQQALAGLVTKADRKMLDDATKFDDNLISQYKDADEAVKGIYILKAAKEANETLDLMSKAGSDDVKSFVRDVKAYKQGNIVVEPGSPAKAKPVAKVAIPKALNNQQQVVSALHENGALTAKQLTEITGLTPAQIDRVTVALTSRAHTSRGANEQGKRTYSLTPEGEGAGESAFNWKRGLEEDLSKQLRDTEPGAAQENATMQADAAQALEDLDTLALDGVTPSQRAPLFDSMLSGKSKESLDAIASKAENLPDELRPYHDEIKDRVGKLLNRRRTPSDTELEVLTKHLDDDPQVNDLPEGPWPRAEDIPKSLKEIQQWGGTMGTVVEEVRTPSGKVSGYVVTQDGKRVASEQSLNQVWAHVNALARGEVRQDLTWADGRSGPWMRAHAIATRKGLAMHGPRKDGTYVLKDRDTGDVLTFKDFNEMEKQLDKSGIPEQAYTKELETAELQGGPPAAAMVPADTGPAVSSPVTSPSYSVVEPKGVVTLTGEKVDQPLSLRMELLSNPMRLMKEIDSRLGEGSDLYGTFWRAGHDADVQRDLYQRPFEDKLNKILSGHNPGRYYVLDRMMYATTDADILRFSKDIGATKSEVAASRQLRAWYTDLIGEDSNNLLLGVDLIREYDGRLESLPDGVLPKSLLPFLEDIRTGKLSLTDGNALTMATEMLHAMGRKKYMEEPLRQMEAIQRSLAKRSVGKLPKNTPPSKRELLVQAAAITRRYLSSIRNRSDPTAKEISIHAKRWAGLAYKMGLVREKNLTAQDVERLAMMTSSWYSGSVMSWRAALAVRNLFQPMLMAPKVGLGNTIQGYKDAISAHFGGKNAEMKHMIEQGLVTEPAFFGLGGAPGSRVGGTIIRAQTSQRDALGEVIGPKVGRARELVTQKVESTERFLRKMQSTGLWGFRKADQFNRAASYFAGKRAMENAKKHFDAGDIDEFKIQSGLAGDSAAFQNKIMKMLHKGKWDEAAEAYGLDVSRQTQFLYSKAEAPRIFQGTIGRLNGQFGIWPLGYLDYLDTQVGGVSGGGRASIASLKRLYSKEARGQYATNFQDRYRALFIGRYMAQVGILSAMGAAAGVNMSSFNKSNPLAYQGGPMYQMMRDTIELTMHTGTQYSRSVAKNSVKRFIRQMAFGVQGAFSDLDQMDRRLDAGESPYLVLMEYLGFPLIADLPQ